MYLQAESLGPSGEASDPSDHDRGSWPQHVDYRDLPDDDRVMLWQPEPATGLGNSLQGWSVWEHASLLSRPRCCTNVGIISERYYIYIL